jgi:hypothetical protein
LCPILGPRKRSDDQTGLLRPARALYRRSLAHFLFESLASHKPSLPCPVGIPKKACPGPSHAAAAWAAIRELSGTLRLSLPEQPHHFPWSARAISPPYLGENTTRRGRSLAGYQFLWKALADRPQRGDDRDGPIRKPGCLAAPGFSREFVSSEPEHLLDTDFPTASQAKKRQAAPGGAFCARAVPR